MEKKLQIKNFKCFPDNEIPLNKLTVFAGANGSGKSTAIQALLLLRQTVDRLKFHGIKEDLPVRVMLNESYKLNLGNSKDVTCVRTDSDQIDLIISSVNRSIKVQYTASKNQPELFIQTIPARQLIEILNAGNRMVVAKGKNP